MSMDAAAGWQDDLPRGGAEPSDAWGTDFSDPFGDLFSAEIEDIDTSEWDVDTSQIWGDDTDAGAPGDGGLTGGDIPV